ncbi:hypothetical protein BGZ63DRAFT_400295 [Mariannaea sp. PMI_226]|nr:hypothetical protein BGZ63DRAFT_400295 [Mariannaea sp. PMI_226]
MATPNRHDDTIFSELNNPLVHDFPHPLKAAIICAAIGLREQRHEMTRVYSNMTSDLRAIAASQRNREFVGGEKSKLFSYPKAASCFFISNKIVREDPITKSAMERTITSQQLEVTAGLMQSMLVIVVPHIEEANEVPAKVCSMRRSMNASIKMDAQEWESLPTLHHVAAGLAKVPVYSIIGAKVVEKPAISSFGAYKRIE